MARMKDTRPAHLSLDSTVEPRSAHPHAARQLGVKTHLQPDDIEVLRNAIENSLCEGEINDYALFVVDEELRKSIRVACAKARLQRVRAEHLLIDVKQIWSTMPNILSTHASERLNEIVTACIDEYYAKDARTQS